MKKNHSTQKKKKRRSRGEIWRTINYFLDQSVLAEKNGLIVHVHKLACTNGEQGENKNIEEVCSGKKVIGMKKWQQRLEAANLYDAATPLGLKAKRMYVGIGFYRTILIKIDLLTQHSH